MKQDLREALPKVRNPPSFTLRKEKNKGGFVKLAPGSSQFTYYPAHLVPPRVYIF